MKLFEKYNAIYLLPILSYFYTILIYWPSLHYDFVFDDLASITQHFNIRHNTLLKLFFSGTRWVSYWLSALYYSIARFNPFPYRFGNVIIHCTIGFLIFFIIRSLLETNKKKSFFSAHSTLIAFITMLLFLLHPVQTQTVCYVIQGQLEGSAMLCIMGIIFCFIHYNQALWMQRKIIWASAMIVIAMLACGTKEIAIVTPLLLLLTDWFFFSKAHLNLLKKNIPIHAIISSTMGLIYLYFLQPAFFIKALGMQMKTQNNLGNIITKYASEPITAYAYLISQFKVLCHYIKIFFLPTHLSIEYDWKLAQGFFSVACLVPLSCLLLIFLVAYKIIQQNKTSPIVFGICWFFIAILPRASIIPSSELIADYKTYTASFGILFIIACMLSYLLIFLQQYMQHFHYYVQRAFYVLLLLIFICPLSIITIKQNSTWRSSLDFWANMLANAPDKARVQNNYGVELSLKLTRYEEAIPYFKKAIELDPLYRDAYNNLAVAYGFTNQIDLAIETLYKTLDLNPYYPEAYNNLASFLIERKRFDEALKHLDRAIALSPTYGKAHYNKGRAYYDQANFQEAYIHFKNACINADLDNEVGFGGLARVSMVLNKFEDALFACKKILEISPNHEQALFTMANAYFATKRYRDTIATYNKLLEKNPQDQRCWYNIGECYLQLNEHQQALVHFNMVQYSPEQLPMLYVKKITCFKKLGQNEQASALTQLLCNNKRVSAELKKEAEKINNQA